MGDLVKDPVDWVLGQGRSWGGVLGQAGVGVGVLEGGATVEGA